MKTNLNITLFQGAIETPNVTFSKLKSITKKTPRQEM